MSESQDPFDVPFVLHHGNPSFLENVMASLAQPTGHEFLAAKSYNAFVKPVCHFCGAPEDIHTRKENDILSVDQEIKEAVQARKPRKAKETDPLIERNNKVAQWIGEHCSNEERMAISVKTGERQIGYFEAVAEALEAGAKNAEQVLHYLENGVLGDEFELKFPNTPSAESAVSQTTPTPESATPAPGEGRGSGGFADGFEDETQKKDDAELSPFSDEALAKYVPNSGADSATSTEPTAEKVAERNPFEDTTPTSTPQAWDYGTTEARELGKFCAAQTPRLMLEEVKEQAWQAGARTFAELMEFAKLLAQESKAGAA